MPVNIAKLNRTCEEYCGQLRNKVVLQRKFPKQGNPYWDYPTVASVCQSDRFNCKRKNFSRPMRSCNNLLLHEIQNYGNLGEPATRNRSLYNGSPNYPLGNCAEQHAANDVLNELDQKHKPKSLNDLYFSRARYVRDSRELDACVNCRTILPNAQ